MHYLNLLTAALTLLLASGASAGQFSLHKKNTMWRSGCDLKIDNVCGCSKTLAVHKLRSCDKLPDVWTGGKVCGGKWQLNTKNPLHTVRFEKKGCKAGCNLRSMKAYDPDDPASKTRGAKLNRKVTVLFLKVVLSLVVLEN
ncbi:MAG: hypothetical protein LQ344_000624 [Seirophora lacunosa]|nr:MAG: hypothetical protein LQ344_000624 [Seirophora lacunosa]